MPKVIPLSPLRFTAARFTWLWGIHCAADKTVMVLFSIYSFYFWSRSNVAVPVNSLGTGEYTTYNFRGGWLYLPTRMEVGIVDTS